LSNQQREPGKKSRPLLFIPAVGYLRGSGE
jgi:hypothetical protein